MYQPDRGNYKTQESVGQAFYHSCLGKLVILAVALIVLFIVAIVTKPTNDTMQAEITDDILQCIQANDSIKGDDVDDTVNNIGFIFTKADTSKIYHELIVGLNKFNRLEIHNHTGFRTAYIHNNLHPEGVRVGWGVFGLVFPTVHYKDLLLDAGPIHKGYGNSIIRSSGVPDTDLGVNPNVTEFHYKGDPDN